MFLQIVMNSSEWLKGWAERELKRELFAESMTSVRNFVFIWNVFEAEVFNKEAHVNDMFSSTIMAPDEIAVSTYDSIKKRYIEKETGDLKDSFNGLFNNEHEEKYEQEVIRILSSSDEICKQEMNLVCRMITWRYRCNLFHGEKSAYYLFVDNILFDVLNQYMIGMIDTHRRVVR